MITTDAMREAGRKVLAAATLGADLGDAAAALFAAMSAVAVVVAPTPAPAQPATPATDQRATVGDSTLAQSGPWSGYCQPYNKAALAAGEKQSDTITYVPSRIPSGVVLSHAWPNRESGRGPWGCNALNFGNYWNTLAKAPVPSRQVKAIQTLTQTISLSMGGDTIGFNVLMDMILTAKAADFTTRIEIDWMVHCSDGGRRYVATLPVAGTFTEPDGHAWKVAFDKSRTDMKVIYVYGEPGQDKLTGTLALSALFDTLRSLGLLTGEEFYNGHLIGTEPVKGTGFLVINDTSVDYR